MQQSPTSSMSTVSSFSKFFPRQGVLFTFIKVCPLSLSIITYISLLNIFDPCNKLFITDVRIFIFVYFNDDVSINSKKTLLLYIYKSKAVSDYSAEALNKFTQSYFYLVLKFNNIRLLLYQPLH